MLGRSGHAAVELWSIPTTSWLLLIAGPLLFLVSIAGASILLTVRGVSPDDVADHVSRSVSRLLLAVLLGLGILFVILRPARAATIWSIGPVQSVLVEGAVGAIVGVALAVAYMRTLAPLVERLQASLGDYVPAGSILPTLSSDLPAFFLANVLLAPVVEETVYRGFAIPLLAAEFGLPGAVALSCLLFGLLHWPGGFWYVVLTGVVAGGLFAGLFLWSGGIVAPFIAHLALNLVEFGAAWRSEPADSALA